METKRVKVKIRGEVYTILGGTDSEYIQHLAKYVDSRMDELSKDLPSPTPTRLAILTALNLADELFQMKEEIVNPASPDAEEKTKKIISLLEEGIIGETL